MYKSNGIGWKGVLIASILGTTTGIGIANYDVIDKKIGKITDSIFVADAQFRDYKGVWEPYTVKSEDGMSPIWKVSRQCTRELGANSEHWREQIKKYNKDKKIDGKKIDLTKPLEVGDSFYVPKDCGCSAPSKK